MKKILLGTTAIVAMSVISQQAFAAEAISLSVGGFMNDYIGYANDDDPTNSIMNLGMQTDTEVNFKGNTTLDNGINVAVEVQLETDGGADGHTHTSAAAGTATTNNTGNMIDRSFLTLSSDGMGAFTVGATVHSIDDFAVGAPSVGPVGWGDAGDWAGATTMAYTANGINQAGDTTIKLKYASPSFSGITAYASYTPGEGFNTASDGRALPYSMTEDGSSLGVAYEGEFSGTAVSANVGTFNDTSAGGTQTVNVGLNVGMNGFTVGGMYESANDNNGTSLDGTAWDLGVSYETGPYAVSAAYSRQNTDGAVGGGSNTDVEWVLGATYDLGAGVALAGNYYHANGNPEGVGSLPSINGVVAGIEVSF